jgi:hypothetical protein
VTAARVFSWYYRREECECNELKASILKEFMVKKYTQGGSNISPDEEGIKSHLFFFVLLPICWGSCLGNCSMRCSTSCIHAVVTTTYRLVMFGDQNTPVFCWHISVFLFC